MNPWEMDWNVGGAPAQAAPAAPPQRQPAQITVTPRDVPPPGPKPWERDWSGLDGGSIQAPGGFDAAFRMEQPANPDLQRALDTRAPKTGLWNNATAGMNEAIYSTLGAPVDFATWLLNQAGSQARAISGAPVQEIQPGVGGSQSLARLGSAFGVNDPAQVQAQGMSEKFARAAGQGAGYALAPEAVLAGLGRAGVVSDAAMNVAGPMLGRSATAGDVAANAVVGAGAGVGGQALGDALPERYRPLAETVGGLLGGGVAAGATALPRVGRVGGQMAADYLAPITVRGQEQSAGRQIERAATSPDQVRKTLATDAPAIVPGSQPTTFQLTGDMGLGALERSVQTRSPVEFQQRRADQNAARVSSLGALQPKGNPEAVVATLRKGLADLDQKTATAVESARKTAQAGTGKLGGTGTPESYGYSVRQAITKANEAANAQEKQLWDAVDPGGILNLNGDGVRKAARQIMKEQPKAAKPMRGEEGSIFATAAGFKDVVRFREMIALRSRVSEAMREELSRNGSTRVYARLSQLRGAIEADVEGAVARKAAYEADAVTSGAMREEDTMAAALQRRVDDWRTNQTTAEAGRSDAAGTGVVGTASAPPMPSGSGGGSQTRGRSGNAPGNQGVQDPRLVPNFDEGAADRLKAASAATRQNAETFGSRPVSDVLGRVGKEGPFHVQDSAVPYRFFHAGPTGYQDVQALRTVVGNQPGAWEATRDYAISTLRKAAEETDGTLNPEKVARWRKAHADALRAFPEIDRMVADPVRASETMARLAELRKADLDAFQAGATARLLQLEDPADISRTIGGIFSRQDAARQMALLRSRVKDDPDALEGLRKGVADFITTRFLGNTEAGTSGVSGFRSDAMQTFVRTNAAALRHVFKDGELNALRWIAADLQRSNRSLNAVRIPGQSNTAQDLIAAGAVPAGEASMLARILATVGPSVGGAAAGMALAGPIGTLVGIVGAGAVQAMRKAGLEKVDDLIKDAMLNPDRARLLLERLPAKPTRRSEMKIIDRYKRAVIPAVPGISD